MNWRRRSSPAKPLMMEMNVNSRLSIHSRRDKEFHPAKLTEWVSQKEVFFIRCEEQARLFSKSSYLCVYQPKGETTYITGCKPNIRSDDTNRFMLFRLVKLKEDEVTMCAATTSIAPFIIKFQTHNSDKDLFFEVSSNYEEVCITEEKSKASEFHLKVEKCNYFRILYKKDDQVYYLHAPTKWGVASRQQILSLSLREEASARSYMAFYYASDASSHPRRLHQRELSDVIESSTEDKPLHITCQRSADSDSRHASDLYVKQKIRDSFRVKAKHGKTKRVNKKEQNSEAKDADTGEEQNSEASFSSKHLTKFVLLKKDPIAPFIIKFREHDSDKDLFFEVSSDCKEVRTTKEKSNASRFHVKVEKSDYFKILYKTDGQVYHLYAPAKSATSSQLSLSLKENASARSYMAFYYASDTSRRLQQGDLSDLIKSSAEDKLHNVISCQRSVDCDSRDVGNYLVVKQNENTVKVKQCTTKHLKEEKHFTRFVLQCVDSEQPSTTDSTQTQPSSTSAADPQSSTTEDPSSAGANSETQRPSTDMSSETPSAKDSNSSNGADSSATDSNQAPTNNTGHGHNSTKECDSRRLQDHLSTNAGTKTPSVAEIPTVTGTDIDINGKSSKSSPATDPEQAPQPADTDPNNNSTQNSQSGTTRPSVPEDPRPPIQSGSPELPVGPATGASNGGGLSSSGCGIM